MRPPANAVLFKASDSYGETRPKDWSVSLDVGGSPLPVPVIVHVPTGFAFGMAMDESHAPDVLAFYAIPLGQMPGEDNRHTGPAGVDAGAIGRNAIMMYLLAIGALDLDQKGDFVQAESEALHHA